MTISAHQVDSVLKAYTKQFKTRYRTDVYDSPQRDKYADIVTLSGNDSEKADLFAKISYRLLDVIKKESSTK